MEFNEFNNIINHLPGYLAWKDNNGCYKGCNDNLVNAWQLKNKNDILDQHDKDLVSCEASLNFYLQYDTLALKGKTTRILHNIGGLDPYKSFILEKKPLYTNQQITGMLYYCQEAIHPSLLNQLQNIDKKRCYADEVSSHYILSATRDQHPLSVRESEVLFCTLRGLTAKKTGDILQLSKRTIEFYLDNIKNKFGTVTKPELIIVAIQKGYMSHVPERFIHCNLKNIFN